MELLSQIALQPDSHSIRQFCLSLQISRATYYRRGAGSSLADEDLLLRDHIQRIALAWPQYGYRRITKELSRQGICVNHKRVLRLMHLDNLLGIRRKAFVVTTNSAHSHKIYPNLVPDLDLTGTDQLWVADITYIRLLSEWIYLSVILDAFSRRCIGWALSRSLETDLALCALQMALSTREMKPGLVHHSDRGVQYASLAYTSTLKEVDIDISMGRTGNPYDNAKAESFMKTLKYEEVYLYEYESLEEAEKRIGYFLEEVYNQKRLHSAIGYRPPAEYEQLLNQTNLT
jgi:transposase InsO family protein